MRRLAMAQRWGLALAIGFCAVRAQAQDDATLRLERWQDLRQSFFGNRPVTEGDDKIALDAPDRALDAALVAITVTVKNPRDVKAIYVLIDENPAPLAAPVTFGPAADPSTLKLRVRVNQYTFIHAMEETTTGALYETDHFVEASGGCSAPVGGYDDAALANIGQMKLRIENVAAGMPREIELLIRHPNFNGMQMDLDTHGYTPARFLKSTDVTFNGDKVLHVDSDISMSTDPAISFGLSGHSKGTMSVKARDSDNAVFKHDFEITSEGS
jgi:sulfur-oxidizing protein SoxY